MLTFVDFVEIAILDIALFFIWRYLHDLCRRCKMKEHFSSLRDSKRLGLTANFDFIDLIIVALIVVGCISTLIISGYKANGSFITAFFEWAKFLYGYITFFIIRMMVYLYGKYIYAYYFVYNTKIIRIRYEYSKDENVTYYSEHMGIDPRTAYYRYFIMKPRSVGVEYGDLNHLASLFGDAYYSNDDNYLKLKVNRKTEPLILKYLSLENINCYTEQ